MPRRSRHLCARPGCEELLEPGAGKYCEADRLRYAAEDRKAQPWRRYDAEHERFRRDVLEDHPWCQCPPACCPTRINGEPNTGRGCGRRSTIADHVSPQRVEVAAGRKPNRRDNYQALAKVCHDRKTARENPNAGGRRRRS